MTSCLFPHRVSVRRSIPVGTNGRTTRTTVSTGLVCLLTPMASRAEIENNYSPGVGYDVYLRPGADVRTGDQLVWGDVTLNVRAARLHDVPRIGHIHVLAAREGH